MKNERVGQLMEARADQLEDMLSEPEFSSNDRDNLSDTITSLRADAARVVNGEASQLGENTWDYIFSF